MDKREIMSLFENEEEAQDILEKSRKRIDEIDNDLVNLISERTSLARDIVLAKVFLGMEIYDKSREAQVHAKVNFQSSFQVQGNHIPSDNLYLLLNQRNPNP